MRIFILYWENFRLDWTRLYINIGFQDRVRGLESMLGAFGPQLCSIVCKHIIKIVSKILIREYWNFSDFSSDRCRCDLTVDNWTSLKNVLSNFI